MAFTNKVGATIQNIGGVYIATSGVNITLTPSGSPVQIITASAPIDMILPPEADSNGLVFTIRAITSAITVKNDGGGIVQLVAAGKAAIVACNGTAWATVFIQA